MLLMIIKRIADNIISRLFQGDKILLVLGARQVGKTTLVGSNIAQHKAEILNFDVEIDKRRFLAAADLAPVDALQSVN